MLVNYKVRAIQSSSFTYYGDVYYLNEDYWTTIKLEEGMSDWWVKYYAKANLMKQIAKKMFKAIRTWKRIYLDVADLEVVRPE